MKIQVLGPGCPKCTQLAQNAQAAADELGLDCSIEKITKINDIMAFGVMVTPALAIDGKVVATGKVLAAEEIRKMIE